MGDMDVAVSGAQMDKGATLLRLALLRRSAVGLDAILHQVTEAAAKCLDVARVGVWLSDDTGQTLRCADLFSSATGEHNCGGVLETARYTRYYEALRSQRALAARDAIRDLRTSELSEGYLKRYGIASMLDAPFFAGERCMGVLCAEHIGEPREWTPEEEAFCASLAELLATSIVAEEREAAYARVKRSEELYRSVLHDQSDVILRASADGVLLFANEAAYKFIGLEEAPDKQLRVFDFVPEDDRTIVSAHAAKLRPEHPTTHYEHRVTKADGTLVTLQWTLRALFDVKGRLRDYQAIGRDVTHEREHEARMREAQRLQALAVLSGGIAHDFNNLLTPIQGFAETMLAEVPHDSKHATRLRGILRASERAAQLVRQILVFSRKDSGMRSLIDIAPVVRETLSFLRASLPARIELEASVETDCGAIKARMSDIYQILSNLCANAYQAMPAGGRLRVSASRVNKPGKLGDEAAYFQLLVSDTGHGMEPAVRERIFEPFFTTKPPGQGTGLGLSVVHGTVTALDGTIDVQSQVGRGTSFVVLIPCAPSASVPPARSGTPPRGGQERILVVDDESSVVELLHVALEQLGYRVVARSSANEALVAFQLEPKSFDLVIADLTMPYMGGIELAWRVNQLQRGVPVLLTTGFGELLEREDLDASGIVGLLNKPFHLEVLATQVRKALDERAAK